jgi:hypothetical protein
LEQKRFGKIEAIPAVVWRDFSKSLMPNRLMQSGHLSFGFRVKNAELQVAAKEIILTG